MLLRTTCKQPQNVGIVNIGQSPVWRIQIYIVIAFVCVLYARSGGWEIHDITQLPLACKSSGGAPSLLTGVPAVHYSKVEPTLGGSSPFFFLFLNITRT